MTYRSTIGSIHDTPKAAFRESILADIFTGGSENSGWLLKGTVDDVTSDLWTFTFEGGDDLDQRPGMTKACLRKVVSSMRNDLREGCGIEDAGK